MLGSVRHEVRIDRPADDVWALAGAPERLHEWFPGVEASTVDGSTRMLVLASGIPMPEEILAVDRLQRRVQSRITAPVFSHQRWTLDVLELDAGSSMVVFSTEADPRSMALIIGGASRAALAELKRILEER